MLFSNSVRQVPKEVTDPYWAETINLMRFDNNFNTQAGSLTTVTNTSTTFSSTSPKFGTHSLDFGNNNQWVKIAPNDNNYFKFGTGDFTIEFWINFYGTQPTANKGNFALLALNGYQNVDSTTVSPNWSFYGWNTTAPGWAISWYNGDIDPGPVVTIYTHPKKVTHNTWTHIAFSRVSSRLYIAVDGSIYDAGSYTKSLDYTGGINATTGGTMLGNNGYSEYNRLTAAPATGTGYFRMDELRITKGIGRYNRTFQPPEKRFPTPTEP